MARGAKRGAVPLRCGRVGVSGGVNLGFSIEIHRYVKRSSDLVDLTE